MSHDELTGYETFVSAGSIQRPSNADLRWLAHHHKRHMDQWPWRRWRLAYEMARRGVYHHAPLQGNPLQMLREGRLSIGRRALIEQNVTIHGNVGARILIGAGAGFNRNVTLGAGFLIVIGDNVLVGPNSYITDVDHVYADPERPINDQGMATKGPVIIEDNVWLGTNVVVTSGVHIGRGSVIGANSVVTRDVEPYSIVYGPSAKGRPRADLGMMPTTEKWPPLRSAT